jgi:hypothetical protein
MDLCSSWRAPTADADPDHPRHGAGRRCDRILRIADGLVVGDERTAALAAQ